MSERLHKVLAQHGLGSRREIEKWMLEGRVMLNGKPASPGDRYSDGDRVSVDGKDVTARLRTSAPAQVLIYHKPQGQPVMPRSAQERSRQSQQDADEAEIDERNVASVMERLPSIRGARWLAVNAMQPADSGLLVLTTDGALADRLRRRAESIRAAYVVRALVPTPDFDPARLPRVVRYDEETVEFEDVQPAGGEGTNRWFRVESRRAHRRAAVRALFESNGLKVSRVMQVRFANVELPRDLPRGRHRALAEEQVAELYRLAHLEPPVTQRARGESRRTGSNRRIPPDRRVTGSRRSGR
jgi:23S rRNA pseudouridine2605 synthase